ncbi:MAG: Holliday junction resolvase RuvX [Acidimicrobiia bacterium]|jgi:putative Holliday junction resolvase
MARVLGVDLGEKRIGLACSDSSGVLASPLRVLVRSGDPAADRVAVVEAAREAEAQVIVVGLPRSLSGREGPAARGARGEAAALAELADAGGIRVELHDERFTTRDAQKALSAGGRNTREQRDLIDAAAAAVMLQSYLDSTRGGAR